jgi:hypothetical protein
MVQGFAEQSASVIYSGNSLLYENVRFIIIFKIPATGSDHVLRHSNSVHVTKMLLRKMSFNIVFHSYFHVAFRIKCMYCAYV